MDTFLIAFKTVLPLFLLIITGIIFSRTKVSSENWIEVLNKYALWIGFPALIIFSLMKLNIEENAYSSLILFNSIFLVGSIILVFPVSKLFRLSVDFKRALFLILPFGNVSYLGIPILYNAFGEKVLPAAALISAVYVFWLLTLALFLIEFYGSKKTSIKKQIKSLALNPLLLSVFIGLVLVVFKIQLPEFLSKTISLFSDSVTAVVLFSLGIFLGMQKIGKLKDWVYVALLSLVTMVVLPYFLYLTARFTQLEPISLKALILDAAMPLGVTPYVLAVQYKVKPTLVARVVVFGTILSVLIIPLWMVFLS